MHRVSGLRASIFNKDSVVRTIINTNMNGFRHVTTSYSMRPFSSSMISGNVQRSLFSTDTAVAKSNKADSVDESPSSSLSSLDEDAGKSESGLKPVDFAKEDLSLLEPPRDLNSPILRRSLDKGIGAEIPVSDPNSNSSSNTNTSLSNNHSSNSRNLDPNDSMKLPLGERFKAVFRGRKPLTARDIADREREKELLRALLSTEDHMKGYIGPDKIMFRYRTDDTGRIDSIYGNKKTDEYVLLGEYQELTDEKIAQRKKERKEKPWWKMEPPEDKKERFLYYVDKAMLPMVAIAAFAFDAVIYVHRFEMFGL